MRIVFFGTPLFAARVLRYLLEQQIQVAAVVTKPDRPQGRSGQSVSSAVKQVALSQIPPMAILQPESTKEPEFAQQLSRFEADLFVVVAFGEIIRENLLNMPKIGCINLHASLLPKYRGAAPIQRSIINGEKESGVTIMHMAKKMDAGDIISTVKVAIGPETSYGELEEQLCTAGAPLLLQAIHDLEKGIAKRHAQDHEAATYAAKLELEDCQIDWTQSAESIHNLIRGVTPHPGAWCLVELKGQPKRLTILQAQRVAQAGAHPKQLLFTNQEGIAVACGHNSLLIKQLKLEGKKAMNAAEFFRGVPEGSLNFL